jgi:hypothetical protein
VNAPLPDGGNPEGLNVLVNFAFLKYDSTLMPGILSPLAAKDYRYGNSGVAAYSTRIMLVQNPNKLMICNVV